ncbi:MAG: hypothetical protein Q2306_01135 [Phytoplasma sp.]|uniref:hypothetical protein n=1 Tax=Phytoplasma sp. TaxID=2155 RepID=UPI002B40631E|nr:hypothetical protein [Phytoplasma sp.]WRH06929.1 MAG: hypothetical protein Q2306_01135 [Phytoplasma sp.]
MTKRIEKIYWDGNDSYNQLLQENLNTFEYNNKNQLVYLKNEIKNIECIFKYNNKNQLVSLIDFKNGFKVKFKYNIQNQLVQKIIKYHNNLFISKKTFIYEYNDLGQKTKKILYKMKIIKNFFFSLITQNKIMNMTVQDYKYNEQGLRMQKITKNIDNTYSIYKYKYFDVKNNKIIE